MHLWKNSMTSEWHQYPCQEKRGNSGPSRPAHPERLHTSTLTPVVPATLQGEEDTYAWESSWGQHGSHLGAGSPSARSKRTSHPGSCGRWPPPCRCRTGGSWECPGGTCHHTRSWSDCPKRQMQMPCILILGSITIIFLFWATPGTVARADLELQWAMLYTVFIKAK